MEIDRLDIVIATSVEKAKNQINQLKNEIEGVKTSLNGVKKNDSISQTSKGAGKAAQEVRNHTKRMVADYKKAAKSMSSIRDEMYKKPIKMPVSFEDAEKQLANFQRQFEKAKDYVMSARQRGEAQGKVYRSNVENMYNAARGASQMRAYMRRRQEENLADLTPEQKAFAERLEKVKAGTWDYAKEAAEEAAKAAEKVRQANEQVVQSYKDIETSASKAYNIKYANPNKDLLSQAKNAQKGNEPFKAQFAGNTMWQNTVDLMKNTFKNFVPNIRYIGEQMRTQIGVAFDNMKAKADSFRASMREKAVASGILSYTQDFVTLQKSIAKTRAEYARLTEAMREYKESGGSESDRTYQRYTARANRLKSELDTARDAERAMKADGSAYEINTKVAEANLQSLRNAFSRVADAALRTTRAIGKFIFNISGIRQAARIAQNGFKSLTIHAKKLWKEFERVGKMAKLMITRMAIRAVLNNVGEGFQSLALHSEQFNSTMSSLINSSKTLGYSIAGMISPLINALAPALMKIIELATRAVNALNQLFSVLSGAKTWNRAKNFTDSWADSIKGAGSAASKATKEIKKTVLGFDELNQLQDNKDSGGGAGGITDMFETVPIEQKWKDFAKWLKDMWEDKNFYDLGKLAGEKLKAFLESIPWDKIRQTSNDLGKCLATLINGFVEVKGLGYDIGQAIAQSLNTIFEFVNGFVHNLHWESIGAFIADTFNGFFESIDWDLIEDTVITGIKGFANAINSFVRTFHWDNISEFISRGINTVVEGIYSFFKTVDWIELARNLGDQMNKAIEKIDWRMIGKTIGVILQSAINFVKSFLSQINWKSVVNAIKELLKGFFEEVNKEDLAKALIAVLLAVVGLAVAKLLVNEAIKRVGLSIISAVFGTGAGGTGLVAATAAGTSIAGAFLAGLGTVFAGLELIKNSVFDASKAADYGVEAENLNNLKEAYKGLGGTVELYKEGFQELWYKITGNTEALEHLHDKGRKLTDLFGETTKVVDGFGNTIIDFTGEIDKNTDAVGAQMTVYDNWMAQFDEVGEAARIGAQKMIDIHIAADGANDAAKDGITIFPKLGDETYKAATAEESLSAAVKDYQEKVKAAQEHQTVYKTTLDVIREAQKKNVKIHEEAETQYGKFKTVSGELGIYIKDNKEAYIKAGEAAKDTTDKVSKYMGTTKDEIKVVADNNAILEKNKPAFDNAGESAKNAGKKLENYIGTTKDSIRIVPENTQKLKDSKDAFDKVSESTKEARSILDLFRDTTGETANKIPDMTRETQNITSEMENLGDAAVDTSREVKNAFSEDNWTFSGVADGLRRTFEDAKSAIRNVWNDIANDLNGSHDIGSSSFRIKLPKIYAAGGFPEDGVFMANHTEMVGRFSNGKTAVANNRQIVAGIQSGVYDAVLSAMANSNNGASYISNEIIVDGETIARTITKAQQKQQRRYSPTMG